MSHLTYKLFELPKEKKLELIQDALGFCDSPKVEKLESFRRECCDKSPQDIINKLIENDEKWFYTFIFRNIDNYLNYPPYCEVAVSSCGSTPELFLWLDIPLEKGYELIEKYNLKVLL